MVPADEELFAQYRAHGDCQALGQLFHRRAGELLRLAVFLAPEPHEAEDLVQATFLSAITHADSFRPDGQVMSWLCGILANHARMLQRARRRPVPTQAARDDVVDPEAQALRAELQAALAAAMRGLPEPYRSVVQLHLHTGLDSREIGERLRRPPATVRKQLERALAHLRRALPFGLATGVLLRLSPAQLAARATEAAVAAAAAARHSGPAVRPPPRRRAGPRSWPLVATVAGLAGLGLGPWALRPSTLPASLPPATIAAADARTLPVEPPPPAPADHIDGNARAAVAHGDDAVAELRVLARWLDGSQAADVELRLAPSTDEPLPSLLLAQPGRVARTDRDGIATFRWPVHAGAVLLPAGGLPLATVAAPWPQPLAVTLAARTPIDGTVVDEDGAAVAGAEVFAAETGGRGELPLRVARTDADGRFAGVVPWPHARVYASAAGHCGSSTRRAGDCRPARFTLPRGGRTTTVRVLGPDGRPAAFAYVGLVPTGPRPDLLPAWHGRCDAAGTCRFDGLDAAPRSLVVRADGLPPTCVPLPPDATIIPVALTDGGSVDGRLATAAGTPLAGVRITWTPDAGDALPALRPLAVQTTWSAADGTFRLPKVGAGRGTLRAIADHPQLDFGFRPRPHVLAFAGSDVPAGGTCSCPLTAASLPQHQGRLLDRDGVPLAGWLVAAVPQGDGGQLPDADLDTLLRGLRTRFSTTDADGRFRLQDCAPAVPLWLCAFRRGRRDTDGLLPDGVVPMAAIDARGDVRLAAAASDGPGASLRGTVLGPDGAPLAGRRARLEPRGGLWPRCTRTGGDGTLVFTGIPAGDYVLELLDAQHGSSRRDVHVAAAATAVDLGGIAVAAPASLRVVVAGAKATAEWPLLVQAFAADGRLLDLACSIRGGEVVLGPLPPGVCTVLAHGGGTTPLRRQVTLAAGTTARLELTATAGTEVDVQLPFAAAGNALATTDPLWWEVLAADGSEVVHGLAAADPTGAAFGLQLCLPPGRYTVQARSLWGATARAALAIGAPGGPPVPVTAPLQLGGR